jgi:hypothetical protein
MRQTRIHVWPPKPREISSSLLDAHSTFRQAKSDISGAKSDFSDSEDGESARGSIAAQAAMSSAARPRNHAVPILTSIFVRIYSRGLRKPTHTFGLREPAWCSVVSDSGKLATRTSYLDFAEGAVIELAGQFARVSDD